MEEELTQFPIIYKKMKKRSLPSHNNPGFRRIMSKTGHLNVQLTQDSYNKYKRFTKDFANTLVLIRWRWVTLLVILTNFFFYVSFAGLWMFDAWLSDDFNTNKTENFCIETTRNFAGYLLLSIETITTTGYGYFYPSDHCEIAWVILTLSTVVMILIDGAFISVVFLKICKPLKKDATELFSKNAVVRLCGVPAKNFHSEQICLRNGKLCLIFRIDDNSQKHTLEPQVKLFLTGRTPHLYLEELEIKPIGMLLWPTDIMHEINEGSPLWNVSASDLMNSNFEIFVTISGTSLVTNQFSTSQTSYLNEEIFWGYRFRSCMEFDDESDKYRIYEQNVFKVSPCDTPLCSARELKKIQSEIKVSRVGL